MILEKAVLTAEWEKKWTTANASLMTAIHNWFSHSFSLGKCYVNSGQRVFSDSLTCPSPIVCVFLLETVFLKPKYNTVICISAFWLQKKWHQFLHWKLGPPNYTFKAEVGASLVAQLEKNLPAMRETWVWSLGWEDPLEKEKATHSKILA